ncbi:hypothetical protein [Emticicia oligotrophica]|nr:hypothetical protein [Emticicia oligotrophica]
MRFIKTSNKIYTERSFGIGLILSSKIMIVLVSASDAVANT